MGFNVSDKIKKDIWSDSYVDLVTLSPNFNEDEDDDVLFKTNQLKFPQLLKRSSFYLFISGLQLLTFLCLYTMLNIQFYFRLN